MALQLWLPLQESFDNYGLCDVTTITTTPTFVDGIYNKAIGTGSYKLDAKSTAKILNNNELTISLWLYVDAPTGSTTQRAMIFGNDNMSSDTDNRKFSLFQYPSCNDLHYSFMSNTKLNTDIAGFITGVLPSYQWSHICMIYKNPSLRIYINGEIKLDTKYISKSNTFENITTVIHNSAYHRIFDYRIYDNAITLKDLKEILRLPVLHFPLSHYGINSNMCKATDTPRVMTNFSGKTNDCRNLYELSMVNFPPDTTKVTFSCKFEYSGVTYDTAQSPAIWIQGAGNVTSWNPGIGAGHVHSLIIFGANESGFFYYTKTITLNTSQLTNQTFDLNLRTDYLTGGTITVSEFKVEPYNYKTQWCPHPSDTNYADFISELTTEYDMTGSGRYITAFKPPVLCSGCPNSIGGYYLPDNNYMYMQYDNLNLANGFTVAIWAYPQLTDGNRAFISKGYFGPFCIDVNEGTIRAFYYTDTTNFTIINSTKFEYNKWNHFALVYDRINLILYINGVRVGSTPASTAPIINNEPITLGCRYAYNTYQRFFNGRVADFRLYASGLSDDSVKELYLCNTGFGKNGEIYTKQFIEHQEPNLITDWTNTSLLKQSGWTNAKKYESENGYLTITSTNGWTVHMWDIGTNTTSPVLFKFEYRMVDNANLVGDDIGIITTTDASYNTSYIKRLDTIIDYKWKSVEILIKNPLRYIGIMTRGVDKTGLSVIMNLRHISIIPYTNTRIMKNGNIYGRNFTEKLTIIPDSMETKTLDDGSLWGRIFHHDITSNLLYFKNEYDNVLDIESQNRYSKLALLSSFKGNDNKYEFLLEYPIELPGEYNRWKQSQNPCDIVIETTTEPIILEGYEPIHIDWTSNGWNGLSKSTAPQSTYLDGSAGVGSWHYAIGQFINYYDKLAGPKGPISVVDLWVRLDTSAIFTFNKTDVRLLSINSSQLIEI